VAEFQHLITVSTRYPHQYYRDDDVVADCVNLSHMQLNTSVVCTG